MPQLTTISARDLDGVKSGRGVILDVRTKMEHAEKRLACVHEHTPLDELDAGRFMSDRGLGLDSEVYILCRSGKRAAQAAEKFIAAGYRNIKVVEGGIVACEDCGHDIKGYGVSHGTRCSGQKGPVSLERQVRIAAGLMVVTGALMGLFIHSLFSTIPLIVGAGLVFAGVTDRCGMALLLTKAPWNCADKP